MEVEGFLITYKLSKEMGKSGEWLWKEPTGENMMPISCWQ